MRKIAPKNGIASLMVTPKNGTVEAKNDNSPTPKNGDFLDSPSKQTIISQNHTSEVTRYDH